MPEDEQERGGVANERIAALLRELGWSEHNMNVDVPCTSGAHTDRSNDHGVDGYFSYEDPYGNPERGVFVESKIAEWGNIDSRKLKDSVSQSLEVMECVPEADEFETRLNSHEDRNYHYGVVSIWSSDEFYESDFQTYVSEAPLKRRDRGTYRTVVLGNSELNKLARISDEFNNLNGEGENGDDVYFYYPSMIDKPYPHKLKCLSMEYMASDIVFAQMESPNTVDGDRVGVDTTNIVFHFGDFTVETLDVVFQSLVNYSLLTTDEVQIYYDNEALDRGIQDIRAAISLFRENVAPDDEDDESPEFTFKELPSVSYDGYTNRLMEEEQ
jgi:hypothetical protein